MVPEIWSATDRIFYHFLPFYPFFALTTQKIKILKKWRKKKKKAWRYHFTHVYHKWRSYEVWFLRYGAYQTELLSFWTVFALLPPPLPNNLKNQNFENWKKHLKILSFYTCVPQNIIIWCMVPDVSSARTDFLCHFGPFFALLLP